MQESSSIPEELLQRCTVRVQVGPAHKGTGFFVAPGVVVTCAHVVQRHPTSELTVVDRRDASYSVEETSYAEEDLAVLRLTPGDQPCALLDASLRPSDDCYTFGYPQTHQEGVPTALAIEGRTGAVTNWLKLSGGQVQPGMSGSPLLNVRTGAVCAVIKRTRDEQQDLGGYAIPVTTLFEKEPTLRLANERYHESHPSWLDRLAAEQRRTWKTSRRTREELATETRHLIVLIDQSAQGWRVTARLEAPDGVEELGPIAVDLNSVRQDVARLFRDAASRGRVDVPGQIQLLGRILYRAVFPDAIGAALARLRESKTQRLAVSLGCADGTDADLVYLPWEHLYLRQSEETGVYLAADRDVTFARSLSSTVESHPKPTRSTLSVLVVNGGPKRYGEAAESAVDQAVTETVRHLDGLAAVSHRQVDRPLYEALEAEVASGDYDVVHYIGSGRFDGTRDQLALGADNPEGIHFVDIDLLADALGASPPRVVVLQLCSAEQDTVPADFALLARALLNLPVPAVVAFQYPIAPRPAGKANGALYEELARGSPVDQAVQRARRTLRNDDRSSRAFVSPALCLRAPGDLRLVSPSSAQGESRSGHG